MIVTAPTRSLVTPSLLAKQQTTAPLMERRQFFTSFPKHYVAIRKMDGIEITFRSIQPEDEPLLIEFHKTLSDQSVHFRYFGAVSLRQRTLHERLRRHCAIDYAREFALVAERKNTNYDHEILGVARLFWEPGRDEAEFAILISDSWQGKGLGTQLLKLLVRVGGESRLHRIIGHILGDNTAMTQVSRKVGFSLRRDSNNDWHAEMNL